MAQIYEALVQKLAFQHFNIICGCASKSLNEDKNTIDDKIIKLLDDAREHFETGFPNLGIPPLDPLILEKTQFNVYQKAIINAEIDLYNVAVGGLKEYFINNLNLKISDLTIDFDVTIPELLLTFEFLVNGKVAGIIPYNPKGEARIEISDITAKGLANLATDNGTLIMKAFHVTLDIDKTKQSLRSDKKG
ncbi:uncharacterized protein LOC143912969 isoform X2 [Arctopsyche grandis]|uniref:uncharacterized protein LOC143912968 isoform X2 n=1 Tax=Arctopsyche grandis TaxID=121162 RepID=UPI00406D9F26